MPSPRELYEQAINLRTARLEGAERRKEAARRQLAAENALDELARQHRLALTARDEASTWTVGLSLGAVAALLSAALMGSWLLAIAGVGAAVGAAVASDHATQQARRMVELKLQMEVQRRRVTAARNTRLGITREVRA